MDGGKAAPGRRAGEGEGATPKGGLGRGGVGGRGPRRERRPKKRGGHDGKAGRKEGAAEKKFTTKSIRCGGVSLQL